MRNTLEIELKTIFREDGPLYRLWYTWRQWPKWRNMAIALIVFGVIFPLFTAIWFRSIWQPFFEATGIAIVAVGLAWLFIQNHREMSRRMAPLNVLISDMQRRLEMIERSVSQVEAVKNSLAALDKTVDGERRNLGMVAEGLGAMRQVVRLERQNLGLVAYNVDEIRDGLKTFQDAFEQFVKEPQGASFWLHDVAAKLGAVSTKQEDLERTLLGEQHNLGMVAGALDDLRRLAAGVHLFDARQAAFEDTLIQIADRIDQIGFDGSPAVKVGETTDDAEQYPVSSERDA